MTGLIHVYTGDGKGKTTAALGLAIRAAGAGMRVLFARFMKTEDSSELEALRRLDDLIAVRTYGRPGFVRGNPDPEDVRIAREGFAEVVGEVRSGAFQLAVLDEALPAVYFGLLDAGDILRLIDERPRHVELVLTGRRADPRIIERADLVTDMREVRHYYQAGITARKGIDL